MKKIILLSIVGIFINYSSFSQSLKDKLNKATGKETTTTQTNSTENTSSGASANQFDEIKKFIAGEKRSYLILNDAGKWYNDMANKAEVDKFINTIKKDAAGNIIEVDSYTPENPTSPLFFHKTWGDDKWYIVFMGEYAFRFQMNISDGSITLIKNIYSTRKFGLTETISKEVMLEDLSNYIKNNRSGYDERLKSEKDAQEKLAAERKDKESIQGKEISSIKIIFDNNATEIRYNEKINFTIESKTKDGKTLSTPSFSPYMQSDFTITCNAADPNYYINGVLHQFYYYTPDDIVTVTVTSKYNAKITATASLKMNYKDVVQEAGREKFQFGTANTDLNATKAPDARVEIKKVKNTLTSEDMIAYKIFIGSESTPRYAFKTTESEYVKVHADAKNSTTGSYVSGSDKGHPAGNVKVIMDPSVPEGINFQTSAKGGTRKGADKSESMVGSDGKIETVKTKVSW